MEQKILHWAKTWGLSSEAVEQLISILKVATEVDVSTLPGGSEARVIQDLKLRASAKGSRLWRNNAGAVTCEDGRHIRYGLANESSAMNKIIKFPDLVGLWQYRVKPLDVGKKIGVFAGVEGKKPGWKYTGSSREQAQAAGLNLIQMLGGFATFATSAKDLDKFDNY